MSIDYERLIALQIPDAVVSYTERDCLLYALSLGLGRNPLDTLELAFVYEAGLFVLPTMAVTLAVPGNWIRDLNTGIDYSQVVHGSQSLDIVSPLPTAATVIGKTRVKEVIDKGPGRGAILVSERELFDVNGDKLLARIVQNTFCRADGGFGGPLKQSPSFPGTPEGRPDVVADLPTSPQMALIYRLNGDFNPLHADPQQARRAGFERPILHGLATFGLVGWSLVRDLCDGEPRSLKQLECRFAAPVFPGETLSAEFWRSGDTVSFRVKVKERDLVVVNNGRAELQSPTG